MKRILLVSAAIALVWASSASAMVTITKHNFTLSSNNVKLTAGGITAVNGEVCVFCHTPHGAASDAPLWNRQMASAGSYTPYTSSTIDAPGARTDRQPQGISLACLSCHDGTIAIDALRNAPGSGNFDATAATRGWGFDAAYTGFDTATNTLAEGGSQPITNLTRNLTTQHPISIEYPYYTGSSGTYDTAFYQPNKQHSSGAWYFDDGATANVMEDSEVRLYLFGGSGYVSVECASCHNPHGTETSAGSGVNHPTLLRKSNNQSALCTTCHIK
ncbi:MAG: cytochrome c3 family protein [Nitrospirota bacterium]|nr:cytochrome c3 family protein [Nitrospirota bacterium]